MVLYYKIRHSKTVEEIKRKWKRNTFFFFLYFVLGISIVTAVFQTITQREIIILFGGVLLGIGSWELFLRFFDLKDNVFQYIEEK